MEHRRRTRDLFLLFIAQSILSGRKRRGKITVFLTYTSLQYIVVPHMSALFNRELKKGSAELLVLCFLEARPRHGYEIGKLIETHSNKRIQFRVGSLYPILCRLEQRGLISGRWVEKPGERRRRYYRITIKGRRVLCRQRTAWEEFVATINQLLSTKYA